MRDWLIRKLGGFASLKDVPLEDVFSAIRALPLEERHAMLTLAVKRLFNTIGEDDILRQHGPQWLWQGRSLSAGQIDQLKAEAAQLQKGFLWKVLSAELRYHGIRKLYTQSEDIPDIVAAKLLQYYIDIVETRLKKMLQ